MRYIACILPWDLEPIAALDVPKFLERLKILGFDSVSLIVRPHQWENMQEVLAPAQQVRDAGMDLLLRIWCDTKYSDWMPKIVRLADGGLNIHAPEAQAIMRDFCGVVKSSGLYGLATHCAVSWSGSLESTSEEMPRYKGLTIGQETAHRDKVRSTIGAAISVLGTGIPIGGQRSCPWHREGDRLELKPNWRENLNVWGDAWWDKRKYLQPSIDLARAAMPGVPMVNEFDVDGWLAREKEWKADPAKDAWSDLPWQDEMLARFRVLKANGIAAQVIHCSPELLLTNADTFKVAGEIMNA